MRADVHRRVQRYGWDRAADQYAAFWEPLLLRCSKQAVAMAAPRPGERVLDVACGAGAATPLLSTCVAPDGDVLGVDLSAQMVRLAARRAAVQGLTNVRFERMDAERLDLPDALSDVSTCVLGLMYPADPDAALREMARVLRPGGRCAVAVWGRRERCGWREAFPIVDARVQSEVCPMFFALGAEGALAHAMRQAGFAIRQEKRTDEVLRFASGESACAAMFAGGPVALAYSHFDEATRAAVHTEYLSSLAAYRDGEAFDVPGEFVYVLGVRR
jgi:ubiquinone/menaquinone biosynthesis C-methylase UbiE